MVEFSDKARQLMKIQDVVQIQEVIENMVKATKKFNCERDELPMSFFKTLYDMQIWTVDIKSQGTQLLFQF